MALTLDKPPLYNQVVRDDKTLTGDWSLWFGSFSDNLETYINQFGITLPGLTTAQRDSIAAPANFQMIGNTTTGEPQIYLSGSWRNILHT